MYDYTIQALGRPGVLAQEGLSVIAHRLANDIYLGAAASARSGEGHDYAGSRAYQAGDSVRRIDWRATARRGLTLTKTQETLLRVPMVLVIDTSGSMLAGSAAVRKVDAAFWIAAALGLTAIRESCGVTMWTTDASVPALPLMNQTGTFLAAVSAAARAGYDRPRGLRDVLSLAAARARSMSQFIVVSDFQDDESMQAVRVASAAHDLLAIRLTDPAERSLRGFGFVRAAGGESGRPVLATRTTPDPSAVRTARDFASAGCGSALIDLDQPIVRSLRQALEQRRIVRRAVR